MNSWFLYIEPTVHLLHPGVKNHCYVSSLILEINFLWIRHYTFSFIELFNERNLAQIWFVIIFLQFIVSRLKRPYMYSFSYMTFLRTKFGSKWLEVCTKTLI